MENKQFESCALIYNPVATKFKEKTLLECHHILSNYFHNIDIKFCKSEYPGHVIDLIKKENDRDLILTLGGDGTVGEAYRAFDEIDQHAIYSHLSVGTTNDMATNLNLSKTKPLKNLEELLTIGTVANIDTLHMDNQTFAYVSAFGYLSEVPYLTNSSLKKKLGHMAYVTTAVSKKDHLFNIDHMDLTYEIDGKKTDTNCILTMITNFNESGGVRLHPYADPTDGLFEVLMVKRITPSLFLEIFPQYLTGKINLKKYNEYIDIIQTDNIHFNFHSLPKYDIDNDGDKANSNIFDTKEVTYTLGKKIKILRKE